MNKISLMSNFLIDSQYMNPVRILCSIEVEVEQLFFRNEGKILNLSTLSRKFPEADISVCDSDRVSIFRGKAEYVG